MREEDYTIGIAGFGVEGQSTLAYLRSTGTNRIIVADTRELEVPEEYKQDDLTEFHFGADAFAALKKAKKVFRSPGARLDMGLQEVVDLGVPMTSQTDFFLEFAPAITIGVTGTKGKTTTSTLMYEVLKAAGKEVYLAGNMGVPMMDLYQELESKSQFEERYVVLELSSFQLQDVKHSPNIAVILPVMPEHLDVHGSFDEYAEAKAQIVAYQKDEDLAFLHPTHEGTIFESLGMGRKEWIKEDKAFDRSAFPKKAEPLFENDLAVYRVAEHLGIPRDTTMTTIREFKGIEHRMEEVSNSHGITFWNDSAGTTPPATMAALETLREPLLLILGGGEKHAEFDELFTYLKDASFVKVVVTVGPSCGSRIHEELLSSMPDHHFVLYHAPDYETLPELIAEHQKEIKHVLLSPACSSFDLFKDYKERGHVFKELAKSYKG